MIGCWEQWLPGQAESWRWMSWSLKIPEWASDQVTKCPPVIHCKNRQKANTRVILGFDGFQPTWLFTDVQKRVIFSRHLSSHVRPHCNVQCQSKFEVIWGLVDMFSQPFIRDSMWTGMEWASRNIRDVPPCVDARCRLMLGVGQHHSQRQIQLTCLSSSLLAPLLWKMASEPVENTICSKVNMNVNLKLKLISKKNHFHVSGASSLDQLATQYKCSTFNMNVRNWKIDFSEILN